jgi:hypothetical protein
MLRALVHILLLVAPHLVYKFIRIVFRLLRTHVLRRFGWTTPNDEESRRIDTPRKMLTDDATASTQSEWSRTSHVSVWIQLNGRAHSRRANCCWCQSRIGRRSPPPRSVAAAALL